MRIISFLKAFWNADLSYLQSKDSQDGADEYSCTDSGAAREIQETNPISNEIAHISTCTIDKSADSLASEIFFSNIPSYHTLFISNPSKKRSRSISSVDSAEIGVSKSLHCLVGPFLADSSDAITEVEMCPSDVELKSVDLNAALVSILEENPAAEICGHVFTVPNKRKPSITPVCFDSEIIEDAYAPSKKLEKDGSLRFTPLYWDAVFELGKIATTSRVALHPSSNHPMSHGGYFPFRPYGVVKRFERDAALDITLCS